MVRYLRFSDLQKSFIWERWNRGDSVREIARLFERRQASVFEQLRGTRGMRLASHSHSSHALSADEREIISRGLVCGKSLRAIAQELNRALSTVSREGARNGDRHHYRATSADKAAWDRAARPKAC